MRYEDVPYYTQDFHPDVMHGMVPDGRYAQPAYIDPIFDSDVMQEISDITQPEYPLIEDEVHHYNIAEDWMPVDPFWPHIPECR